MPADSERAKPSEQPSPHETRKLSRQAALNPRPCVGEASVF
jgi:hypothetical protein